MEPITFTGTKACLQGSSVLINEDYGGLGAHFLDTLFENKSKIHQIETVRGTSETNESVRSRAIQIAHELRHFGILENDIIVICSRGHADQTIVVLACLLIGSIVAPINAELHHKEYVEIVNQLKPKICFCDLRTLKQMERVISEIGITSKMVHFGDSQQYALPFRKLLMNRQYPEQFKPVTIENPRKHVAFILTTQGTTGTPKLICLSHHFIYCQISLLLDVMDEPEKIISFYALSWVMQVVLMCLCFKVPVVRILSPADFAERSACKLIHDFQIDHAFLNTELALHLAEHVAVRDFNLSCLKNVFIGSLTTTSYDINRLVRHLPKARFTQFYWTTEVGAVIACAPSYYEESLERVGSVGKVLDNCKVRIVDINTREDVEEETLGELLVASDCMMLGYFKNLNVTKSCTQDGFFKTGDIAKYDEQGWIFIEGQISDLINVPGFPQSPREMENTLMLHPYVHDAVIISNDKEVVACVIPKTGTKLTEEKLSKFILEKMYGHKVPRIVIMSNFPTTPLGTVRRNILQREVIGVKIEHSILDIDSEDKS